MNAAERIGRAAAATDEIQGHVAKAVGVLSHGFQGGRALNTFEVYDDPQQKRAELHAALDALNAALLLIDVTEWPDANDYRNAPKPKMGGQG